MREEMREDTTRYDQPATDPIPAAPQDPAFTDVPPDEARTGGLDAEPVPGFADPATTPGQPGPQSTEDSGTVLFGGAEADRFRGQWQDLQAGFVDDPASAVQGADHLVDEVMRALTEVFNAHKHQLETQSQSGETEELRVAMRRYRSFFDQLLNA